LLCGHGVATARESREQGIVISGQDRPGREPLRSQVVEIGPVGSLYGGAAHPYTRALLAAMPSMDPDRRTMEAPLTGDPPNPINPPPGCRFHTRCTFAQPVCSQIQPVQHVLADQMHMAACHAHIPGSGHPGLEAGQ
jgi:peptide/nickel transport system ATP-binding protein